MKIYNQWSRIGRGDWGVALFCIFATADFWGIVLGGICLEFARTEIGRRIQESY